MAFGIYKINQSTVSVEVDDSGTVVEVFSDKDLYDNTGTGFTNYTDPFISDYSDKIKRIEDLRNQDNKEITLGDLIVTANSVLDNLDTEKQLKKPINKDNYKILQKVSLINSDDTRITRFQLVELLYNILYDENKLPDIHGYQVIYYDLDDAPAKYVTPLAYVSFLGLIHTEGNYINGYDYVTEQEVKDSFSRLYNYLDSYPYYNGMDIRGVKQAIDSLPLDEETGLTETVAVAVNILDIEIDTTGKQDDLHGQSVAVVRSPETLRDLKKNLDALNGIDFNTFDIINKYVNSADEVYIDLINVYQGLYDPYNILQSVLYPMYNNKKVVGIVKANNIYLNSSRYTWNYAGKSGGSTVFSGGTFSILEKYPEISDILRSTRCAIGIKNNTIVSSGSAEPNIEGFGDIVLNGIEDIDMLGLIVDRAMLENKKESGFELVVLIIHVTNMSNVVFYN